MLLTREEIIVGLSIGKAIFDFWQNKATEAGITKEDMDRADVAYATQLDKLKEAAQISTPAPANVTVSISVAPDAANP